MTNDTVHKSVLSDWVSKVFDFAPGTIIDATAGGGGHTEMLLDMGHKVIAVDRDPDVISRLATRFQGCSEVTLVQDTFSNIDKLGQVDGVLADLGFSSDQMDDHTRGFSFMSDSPPDMRMSQQGETAQELIEQSTDQELTDLIRQYSEEKKAWPIAKRIAGRRFESCRDLAAEIGEIAADKRPWKQKWRKINPATKTFQALRIAVNDELKELERLLELLPEIILPGGRVAIISFHSLEERRVKEVFRTWTGLCTCPPKLPVCGCGSKQISAPLWRGVKVADSKEIEGNPRSRSAKIRAMVMVDLG